MSKVKLEQKELSPRKKLKETQYVCIYYAENSLDAKEAAKIVETDCRSQNRSVHVYEIPQGETVKNTAGFDGDYTLIFLGVIPENLEEILKIARKVVMYDHHEYPHKSKLDQLAAKYTSLQLVFDTETSCAEKIWFSYRYASEGKLPWKLQLLACNEMWRWATAPIHFPYIWRAMLEPPTLNADNTRFVDTTQRVSDIKNVPENLVKLDSVDSFHEAMVLGDKLAHDDEKLIARFKVEAKPRLISTLNGVKRVYFLELAGIHAGTVACELAQKNWFGITGDTHYTQGVWNFRLHSGGVCNVGYLVQLLMKKFPKRFSGEGNQHIACLQMHFREVNNLWDHLDVVLGS